MIRINLLPVKQDRRREAGRAQLLIAAGVIGVQVLILAFVQVRYEAQVEKQRNVNDAIKTKVDNIKREIKDHDDILDEIAEFEKRQEAIEELQAARTGPIYMLLEISNILSKGGRPQIDHDKYQEMIQFDPSSGFDEGWDYRRVWIDSLKEQNRVVTIKGQALTHEDVAEFLRRINLSNFFVTSELVSTDVKPPNVSKLVGTLEQTDPVVHFMVTAQVRYN